MAALELHAALLAGRDTTKIRAKLHDAEHAARNDVAASAADTEKQSAAFDAAAAALAIAARACVAAALQQFDFTE